MMEGGVGVKKERESTEEKVKGVTEKRMESAR